MQAPPVVAEKALPPRLQKALERVNEIGSLPEVTARIVELAENPHVTAHDMDEIIRKDPALAAKVLKVVNSAFYGLPSQIASLDRAVLLLGLSAVKNLALAASLSHLFKAEGVTDQFTARDLWRHCIAVGVCARLLASAARSPEVDETFVAGLTHDMGLIVLQQLFPAQLREVADQCQLGAASFCSVEEEIIGADHQVFGNALAVRWKFPPGLRCAIATHHNPSEAGAELARMCATIYVADTLCSQARFGFWLTAQAQPLRPELLGAIGLDPGRVQAVLAELPARIEEAEQVFVS